jgi:hypothetical protein
MGRTVRRHGMYRVNPNFYLFLFVSYVIRGVNLSKKVLTNTKIFMIKILDGQTLCLIASL